MAKTAPLPKNEAFRPMPYGCPGDPIRFKLIICSSFKDTFQRSFGRGPWPLPARFAVVFSGGASKQAAKFQQSIIPSQ